MAAYTFCIDSMIRGYHEYWKKVSTDQSVWDNPLADGYLLCEREIHTIHRPWLSRDV